MEFEAIHIDYHIALEAHRHTSYVPDERALQEMEDFRHDVQSVYEDMLNICTTKEQHATLEREMLHFATEYRTKYHAFLKIRSRTASSAITGAANFNATRNQKYIKAASKKRLEMLEWRKKAMKSIRKAVLDAKPSEQIEARDLHAFENDIKRRLEDINVIDNGQLPYDRSAFVQNLVSAVERRAMNGEVDLVDRAIDMVQEYNASAVKPIITKRHRFWRLGEIARQKHEEQNTPAEDERWEFDGGCIETDNQAERVRIIFDEKPDAEQRTRLKGAGWRWSPSNGAWQRKLTQAAIASAKSIVGDGQ